MERKVIFPVKCLKRGGGTEHISNIKKSVLWNYAKIIQNHTNKTEISFVKSFIYIMYLYICLFMRSCRQKVSNKRSVSPYQLNIELNSTAFRCTRSSVELNPTCYCTVFCVCFP
jgi:hypothetical protein